MLARPAVADCAGTELGVGGEDAVVDEEVGAWAGDEGGEAGEELEWGECDVGGAVAPLGFELEEDAIVVGEGETFLGDCRAEEVAADALEAITVMAMAAWRSKPSA